METTHSNVEASSVIFTDQQSAVRSDCLVVTFGQQLPSW